MKGRIQINGDREGAVVRIDDDSSGIRVLEVKLSLEEFAYALMSHGYIECEYDANYRNAAYFGSEVAVKSEEVPFDMYSSTASKRSEGAIAKALAPFEVDGWEARRSDMTNGHCRVKGSAEPLQRVVFTRFMRNGEPILLPEGRA